MRMRMHFQNLNRNAIIACMGQCHSWQETWVPSVTGTVARRTPPGRPSPWPWRRRRAPALSHVEAVRAQARLVRLDFVAAKLLALADDARVARLLGLCARTGGGEGTAAAAR
jgi:hypothetical protein